MMYKTYIIMVFCRTMKKNNNKGGTLWGAPFLCIFLRTIGNMKINEFLINFLWKFMNFDVVLCYNKIDYVMEVGGSLSHF